nr:hypothetical protein GCM10025730_27030 [Promicromonospora thailandica]
MRSRRIPLFVASLVAALLTTGAVAVPGAAAPVAPVAPAAVADCSAPAWSSTAVYVGGNLVTHAGASWRAKWWTQGETPGTTGEWGCGSGSARAAAARPTRRTRPAPRTSR